MITKSRFESYVNKALDRFITDYHTFIRIKLFCDYLWQEISEGNINEENERDTNTSSN